MAIFTCDYYSKAKPGMNTFTAILPVDVPSAGPQPRPYGEGPWPTLYLLHGYTGNQVDWLYRSDIEKWAMEYGFAVIMPAGGNSFYVDSDATQERYGVFTGEELVEVTRKMFPLSHRREDTVISGLSMGGYGAIRNGLKYPDTFGAILALSSALITDEVAAMKPDGPGNAIAPYGYYLQTFGDPAKLPGSDKDPKHLAKERLKDGKHPLLFIACGSEDFVLPVNVNYHEYLEEIGYPHEWWIRPGVHDFAFWNLSLPAGLEWLKHKRAANHI